MMGEDTPGTFTPRGSKKGLCFDQLDAFMHMQQLGADMVDAAIACLGGHRMTPDLASLCIATYWRRYTAVANYQECRGAAITIQVRCPPPQQEPRLAARAQEKIDRAMPPSRACLSALRRRQRHASPARARGTALCDRICDHLTRLLFACRSQAAMRGKVQREDDERRMHEAMALTRTMRGDATAEELEEENYKYHQAARVQAVWRGHMSRAYTEKLRWQSKSKLQRTFSWGKKGKARKPTDKSKAEKAGIKERSAKDIMDAAGVDDTKKSKTPIKRSMSFDRFSRGAKSILGSDKKDDDAAAAPSRSKQLLFILLQRGPNGLGLELDATNTVVNLVPGGAADTQGYFREGDTIASCDGIPLRGRLLQDVMDRGKNSYSFDVWRLTPVEPEPELKKSINPVRRAFSFDRKKK